MSREWKPGDVALYEGVRVMFTGEFAADSAIDQEGDERYGGVWVDKHARPLVVINPEDREQVSTLMDTYDLRGAIEGILCRRADDRAWERITDAMQAALRSLVAPPKPEEPLGLGAVVEASAYTDEVRTFVRCSGDGGAWSDSSGNFHTWSELDVVRILADGWQGESDE